MTDQFNILDYTNGPLLKTGQVTDYTPAGRTSKDDGVNQAGINGSKEDNQYIILDTGQYSGTTTITVNSINDAHNNNCVFDKVTGLMWNREQSPAIYGTGAQDLLWDGTASNDEDIFEYCDQANLGGLSGFSDWRVCNQTEIMSLIILKPGVGTADPNTTAFPIFSSQQIWLSNTYIVATSQGITYTPTSGRLGNSGSKTTNRFKCMLVRLGR